MADIEPIETLRRAARLAPTVLPAEVGALVAQKITLALDSPMRVADLHPFYGRLAAEVLALAEQQQPRQDAVEAVDEALAEVRLHIGPNTRSLIADGHWKTMPLSLGERRIIAEIAVAAMKSR